MTLAESTISNAIRYSMLKNGFANVIIAGPICAGKKSIAQLIADFSAACTLENNVTIFYQDDFYKEFEEMEDTIYGVKNIDSKSAFYSQKFVKAVCEFYDNGYVMVNGYNRKKWSKNFGMFNINENTEGAKFSILEKKECRRTNIFVGPHVIDLLTPQFNLNTGNNLLIAKGFEGVTLYSMREPIYIYLEADISLCMERRQKRELMFPKTLCDVKLYKEYVKYIEEVTKKEIAFQKQMADIIVKNN